MEQLSARTRLRQSSQQTSNKTDHHGRRKGSRLRGSNSENETTADYQNSTENTLVGASINSSANVSSPGDLVIHETPEKILQRSDHDGQIVDQNTTTDGLALLPSATLTKSPMQGTNIHNPDFGTDNAAPPGTSMENDQPMMFSQPLVKIIEPTNPVQLKTFGSPQTEAIDYSVPNYDPRPIPPVGKALRKLNKNSIKIEKNSQINVLPGTTSSYKTPGAHNRNKKGKIKRPMNAFMCFARHARSHLCHSLPSLKNADVSVKLGQIWAGMPPHEKQKYFDEAEMIKRQHREEFPDWVYQPGQDRKLENIDVVRHEQWRLQQLQQQQQQAEQMQAFAMQQQPSHQMAGGGSSKKPRKLHKNSYDLKLQGTRVTPLWSTVKSGHLCLELPCLPEANPNVYIVS